ncbi:MAG: glutathione S-transferase N-terminal domain-containing protein [Cohaesibacter sp.]|nr:glutathione S-transferase N-terminal domain-containing protein [Cohaesibacter sp.]
MSNLSDFEITKRWPAQYPNRIQLYSRPTPNGAKISIALEELNLPYEYHLIDFGAQDQMTPEFLSLNPNNKLPAIIDPDGPGHRPMPLWESGAILLYLADKTGKLISADRAMRWQTIQWLLFQVGGIGPMFGQLGFFHKFAGKEIEDPRPRERYVEEAKRLLNVLEKRLQDRPWIMGEDYSIADINIGAWMRALLGFYEAGELVQIEKCPNVIDFHDRFIARPAVVRGVEMPQ